MLNHPYQMPGTNEIFCRKENLEKVLSVLLYANEPQTSGDLIQIQLGPGAFGPWPALVGFGSNHPWSSVHYKRTSSTFSLFSFLQIVFGLKPSGQFGWNHSRSGDLEWFQAEWLRCPAFGRALLHRITGLKKKFTWWCKKNPTML